jgi:hypothetical protein
MFFVGLGEQVFTGSGQDKEKEIVMFRKKRGFPGRKRGDADRSGRQAFVPVSIIGRIDLEVGIGKAMEDFAPLPPGKNDGRA